MPFRYIFDPQRIRWYYSCSPHHWASLFHCKYKKKMANLIFPFRHFQVKQMNYSLYTTKLASASTPLQSRPMTGPHRTTLPCSFALSALTHVTSIIRSHHSLREAMLPLHITVPRHHIIHYVLVVF